jgi:hypothetical protein
MEERAVKKIHPVFATAFLTVDRRMYAAVITIGILLDSGPMI